MAWLLSWLWEGMALTIVVALLLRVARRLNAATRSVIWWTTLVAVLALPALWTIGPRGSAVRVTTHDVTAPAPPTRAPVVIPSVPDGILSLAIGGWLGLMGVRLGRLARSFAHLRRLKRGCVPMPIERQQRLSGWMAARGERRRAALMLSDDVALPSALGLGRPVIALPRGLAADLDDEDLDRIVLHELAHLVRRDDWTRLVQAMVASVAGLHPAVWWIGRMIDLEREAACDDFVVSRTGEPRRYAACLASAAELALGAANRRALAGQALAPGAARAGRELARRVHRLLDRRRGRRPWPIAAALGAGAVATLVALSVIAALSSKVALVDAAPALPADQLALASRGVAWAPSPFAPAVTRRPVSLSETSTRSPFDEPIPSEAFTLRQAWPERAVHLSTDSERTASRGAQGERRTEGLSGNGESREAPSDASLVLTATPIADRLGEGRSMSLAVVSGRGGAPAAPPRGPWQRVADAGAAIGAGLADAGAATAAFFTRAGHSIAGSF